MTADPGSVMAGSTVSATSPRRDGKQTQARSGPQPSSFAPSGSRTTSKVWRDGREYWVYAHRAADGSVLYVGCTADRKVRDRAHRTSSPWYPMVAKTVYKGPYGRADGLRIERKLIEKYDPPNNFMHTSRYVHWRSLKAKAS